MKKDYFRSIDRKGILLSYDPRISHPEDFIDLIKEHGDFSEYRSAYWTSFDRFKPFNYFIVLFTRKGTGGNVVAWGICKREECKRVESKSAYHSFPEAKHSLKWYSDSKFKSLLHFRAIGLFKHPYNCRAFNLLKTGKPMNKLTSLRTALFIEIPDEVIEEIKNSTHQK